MFTLRHTSLFVAVSLLSGGLAWADQPRQHQGAHHIEASGVVTKVDASSIALKTPSANLILNVNATERSGLSQVRVGDELTVWIDEDNNVVDVHQKGHQAKHRLITGKLAYSDNSKTAMKPSTTEGKPSVPIKLEEVTPDNMPGGTLGTVEIDEQGRLMDIHRE